MIRGQKSCNNKGRLRCAVALQRVGLPEEAKALDYKVPELAVVTAFFQSLKDVIKSYAHENRDDTKKRIETFEKAVSACAIAFRRRYKTCAQSALWLYASFQLSASRP